MDWTNESVSFDHITNTVLKALTALTALIIRVIEEAQSDLVCARQGEWKSVTLL